MALTAVVQTSIPTAMHCSGNCLDSKTDAHRRPTAVKEEVNVGMTTRGKTLYKVVRDRWQRPYEVARLHVTVVGAAGLVAPARTSAATQCPYVTVAAGENGAQRTGASKEPGLAVTQWDEQLEPSVLPMGGPIFLLTPSLQCQWGCTYQSGMGVQQLTVAPPQYRALDADRST